MYMCAIAIALGYKNIYLTGIDFYDKNKEFYSFDTKKDNLCKLNKNFIKDHYVDKNHSKEFDIQSLLFLKEKYKINFYSLNKNNILTKYMDLAPTNDNYFSLENKADNYINDILIPSKQTYNIFNNLNKKESKIKQNIYYKLFKDFFRLPSDIKHYIKEKY
ncbi:alpha-2,3-sialyltransferase, partial [Campylobacter molothri]|uniref:alpha-2,3-sialyltransferase n=1 Tax=Campylobacter molothri TaxID=1032242 RepID=UPI00301C29AD